MAEPRCYQIPTGHLLVDTYSRGPLETLSIGDYGRHRNVCAVALRGMMGYNAAHGEAVARCQHSFDVYDICLLCGCTWEDAEDVPQKEETSMTTRRPPPKKLYVLFGPDGKDHDHYVDRGEAECDAVQWAFGRRYSIREYRLVPKKEEGTDG